MEVYNRTIAFFKTYFSILFPPTGCPNGHIAAGFLAKSVKARETLITNLLVAAEIAVAQCIRLPNVTLDNCRMM